MSMDPRTVDLINELRRRPTKPPPYDAMCVCGDSLHAHNMVTSHAGCDRIGCSCLVFNLRPEQETP